VKITDDIIKALKPCKNRYENFTLNYPNFSGDAAEFLNLENITYEDKLWVMTRLLTKNQNTKWAISCAYSVLPIFEKEHPSNNGPREVLEFMSSLKDFEHISVKDLDKLKKLRAAAADTAPAVAAGYAAAAVYAAHTAAAYAAAYAADAVYAAYAAHAVSAAAGYAAACVVGAYAAGYAHAFNNAKKTQQDLNLKLLLEVLTE